MIFKIDHAVKKWTDHVVEKWTDLDFSEKPLVWNAICPQELKIPRDRHVQPISMNFEVFFNLRILFPYFEPGDSENRIENCFGAL